MIYAELIYTGEKSKDGREEFYLEFYGHGKDLNEVYDEWKEELLEFHESMKDNPLDVNFSGKYFVSKNFPLRFLSKKKFTPTDKNFFYKS